MNKYLIFFIIFSKIIYGYTVDTNALYEYKTSTDFDISFYQSKDGQRIIMKYKKYPAGFELKEILLSSKGGMHFYTDGYFTPLPVNSVSFWMKYDIKYQIFTYRKIFNDDMELLLVSTNYDNKKIIQSKDKNIELLNILLDIETKLSK